MASREYLPPRCDITWGNFTDVVTIKPEEEKPQVPKRKHKLDTDYRIAGKEFKDYLFYRLNKDGIGFYPQDTYQTSATDLYSYITAPVPKNDSDFLAYCHELGHCKSRQYANSRSFYNATFSGRWSKERLVSEVNAWKWGLRYFRRLGYKMTDKTVKVVQWALESYFTNADDYKVAKKLSDEFEIYSGISTKVPEPYEFSTVNIKPSINRFGNYFAKFKPKAVKNEKPKGHKPWHDLKQKQMKRQWKNQK